VGVFVVCGVCVCVCVCVCVWTVVTLLCLFCFCLCEFSVWLRDVMEGSLTPSSTYFRLYRRYIDVIYFTSWIWKLGWLKKNLQLNTHRGWLLCQIIRVIIRLFFLNCLIEITLWIGDLLEKLTIGPQLVKKLPDFYGTRRFITAFTTNHHPPPPGTRSIQSMAPIPLLKDSF
jgi:hypothetical protein